jgi:hypothetical protein
LGEVFGDVHEYKKSIKASENISEKVTNRNIPD